MSLCIIKKKNLFRELKSLEDQCNYQISLMGGEKNLKPIYKLILFLLREIEKYPNDIDRDTLVYNVRAVSESVLLLSYNLIDHDYISFDQITTPHVIDTCKSVKYLVRHTSLTLDDDLLHSLIPEQKDLDYVKNYIQGLRSSY